MFATGPGTPGSGQSDVLAVFGTEEQKQRWLYPLLEGKITMIYSMTDDAWLHDLTFLLIAVSIALYRLWATEVLRTAPAVPDDRRPLTRLQPAGLR